MGAFFFVCQVALTKIEPGTGNATIMGANLSVADGMGGEKLLVLHFCFLIFLT